MQHDPTILIVGVPERASDFGRAMKQLGRPTASVEFDQFDQVLAAVAPLAIVCSAERVSELLPRIEAARLQYEVPLFALQKPSAGSMRPPLPGVTACVPEDIDAGIFALRLQQALQQAPVPRARQATVVGLGDFSRPMQVPNAPAATEPLVPWDVPPAREVVSSAPPLPPGFGTPPSSAPRASSEKGASTPRPSRGVVTSAPPLPPDFSPPPPSVRASTPSERAAASDAALPTNGPPGLSSVPAPKTSSVPAIAASPVVAANPRAISAPPDAVPTPAIPAAPRLPQIEPAVSTDRPVTFSTPVVQGSLDDDPFAEAARAKGRLIKRSMAAAGVALLLGVGAVVALGGDGASDPTQTARAAEQAAAAAGNDPAQSDARPEATDAKPKAVDAKHRAASGAPGGALPGQTPDTSDAKAGVAADGLSEEALAFKVDKVTTLPTCETTLGKTAADFSTVKKWRAQSSWKLARKSLMAGQEEGALKHMCESAFIDTSGPAPAGLVKYYLGRRALEQAHDWATRALEAAKGAASKRAAQQLVGDVLIQQGKIDEARKIWLESFGLTADQTDRLDRVCKNFVTSALTARKGGDMPLAEQLLRRAAAFQPDNAATAALLAAALAKNDQADLAERWAKRALAKDPGSEVAQTVLADLGK